MVVFLKYEMEYDGRRGKRIGIFRRMFGSGSSGSTVSHGHSTYSLASASPPRERRPLRSVPTNGPQFKVDPEVLAKEYVEKETKFMGTITDIGHDFDSGNRSMVLSLLDEKRKVGLLPSQLSWRHDAIISFSVCQIKLSRRDGEEVIHRIPTHQIASAGYVQDDNQTILFFKFASELHHEMANLAFFCCESKALAQEICFLTQQLFQLAYTNSTMEFFDKSIQDGAVTPKNHSYSTDDSAEKKSDTIKLSLPLGQQKSLANNSADFQPLLSNGHNAPDAIKASTLPFSSKQDVFHHESNGGVRSPVSSSSTPSSPVGYRKTWVSGSSSGSMSTNNSAQHQLQLKEYIEVLKERLTTEELGQFAQHLHHFRTGSVPIKVFCEQLMGIYTEQRKSLMLGMRHFIPAAKDRSYFETFLHQHGVENTSEDSRWWDRPPHSRTFSETEDSNTSTAIHINELSSNSDHVSTSPTSNEDSGEWKAIVGNLNAVTLEDASSTLKSQLSYETEPGGSSSVTPTLEKNFSRGESTDTLQPTTTTLDPGEVVFGLEEGDSPLLRSGQQIPEGESPVVLRYRKEIKQHKRNKSRGKSPSAVELGAPYPSVATGGTDDDLDTNHEKKGKRGIRYKKKEKQRHAGEKESQLKRKVGKTKIDNAEDKLALPSLSKSTPDLKEKPPGKKTIFKSNSIDGNSKVTEEPSSAASTPDVPIPGFTALSPRSRKQQELRKKRKVPTRPPSVTLS